MGNIISLQGICKDYDGAPILDDINFTIQKNEFLTILGPSGCGKTTTLRIIGGFEEPTSGDLLFHDRRINDLPPYKRNINTVFQKYALFSHMNVFENIAFGLRIRKLGSSEISEKVSEMLRLVNLKGFESRKIGSLSGGQQQRVAIARALVNEPEVLLLDEPLGALDLKLRKEMQLELKRMQKRLGITFIYVTHDQEEALSMSDQVIVMNHGRIQQMGRPEDIYNEPVNAFVADFIGESNIVPGMMVKDRLVRFCGREFPCVDEGFGCDVPVEIVIRPEDLEVVSPEAGALTGRVESATFKGVHYEMVVALQDEKWLIHSTKMAPAGSVIGMSVAPENIHVMSPGGDG